MSKRSLDWTKEKYQRFLKEGRGQGDGANYKPWLTIHDVPSLGRASRVYGWKSGRIHHFFSDIETRYFYLLEWEDKNVVDIREHFPILNIEENIGELNDTRFIKYKNIGNEVPYIITATFLITLRDEQGNIKYVARSLKASHELEKKSVIERYELARRFFEAKNIDFGIVTEKEIQDKIIKTKNIEWLHQILEEDNKEKYKQDERSYLCKIFVSMINGNSNPIRKITSQFDIELNKEIGTGLYIFRYLLATKQLKINMDEKIDLNKPANIVEIVDTRRSVYNEQALDG